MKVLFVIAALICVIPASVEATQQCISCTSDGCQKRFPKTVSCDQKCYKMLLRKESPDKDDPYVAKGCTSDSLFYRSSCANKCYNSKKEFGSSLYYKCVYCCSGDKCNSCSQMKYGTIMVVMSAAIAVITYLYV